MKFQLSFVLLLLLCRIDLFCQENDIDLNRIRTTLSRASAVTTIPNGMRTIPLKAAELEGSFYLHEEFTPVDFVLMENDSIKGLLARYNVKTNIFIIDTRKQFGSLRGGLVREFHYKDKTGEKHFVNTANYPFNPLLSTPGFYNLLFDGSRAKLFGRTTHDIVPSNYNIALDVGERKSYIRLKTDYYLFENGNYKELKKFSNKQLEIFGEQKDKIKKYIKAELLNYRNERDLVKLMKYYEKLVSEG
ncbi:MAG: hypothetical protein RJQ09_16760 [Cyclobacteriaceae bacterium]